ncbi:MAG: aspartate ammonia-lyase, partial [Verrucomicrobiae bacterium]|nr:aspartate ammonia-lyase [Verrucomicrobiae bacterium]
NTMMPVIANNLLLSVELLANGSRVFAERCIIGIEADIDRCKANVEQSLALSTALAPAIGYDKASHIAKVAFDTGRTIRSVASEISGIDDTSLNRLLDPKRQTGG